MEKKGKTEVGTEFGEGVKPHANMAMFVWDFF